MISTENNKFLTKTLKQTKHHALVNQFEQFVFTVYLWEETQITKTVFFHRILSSRNVSNRLAQLDKCNRKFDAPYLLLKTKRCVCGENISPS